MFGLISCVIGLMQHHGAWETHTNVSKTCAFLSLISGFVPLSVCFEAKQVRLFLRIETAKYNVVQQLKIQTKAANAAGLTGALQVAVGAAKHALQEAAGAAKHALQGRLEPRALAEAQGQCKNKNQGRSPTGKAQAATRPPTGY
jgi:hypothetical protein